MKKIAFTLFLAFGVLVSSAQDAPANHIDMTEVVLDFLSRTELCLQSCSDSAATQAAIPQLRQLKEECATIVNMQKQLPEPTVQDYMAVQEHMAAFDSLWKAIRNHLSRMEKNSLITPEVRDILQIAAE